MARTVQEIKAEMETRWMSSPALKDLYGWELDTNNKPPEFAAFYSKASLENVILYIVAYCAYVVERLIDVATDEIDAQIATKVPGSLQWYVGKMKEFVYMPALSADDKSKVIFDDNTGEYTISDTLSEAALDKAHIVKHAVAIDDNETSVLLLKVAGEDAEGNLLPISLAQQESLQGYITRIKYAGVRTELINVEGDTFDCKVSIWYDALYTESEVRADCEKAIENYIHSLPFNGEYSNMALIDHLQEVRGVKVAELTSSHSTSRQDETRKPISAKARPYAGYFNVGTLELIMECYE
jgi:hypothetical protein